MPRRNKRTKEPQNHVTIFDDNFKPECCGCAFAGRDYVCRTSDGTCLKTKPKSNDLHA